MAEAQESERSSDRIRFALAAATYILALAAQVSGYTNPAVALVLAVIGTAVLVVPCCHYVRRWHCGRQEAGKAVVEPLHLIIVGLAGIIIFAAVALGGALWHLKKAPSPDAAISESHSQTAAPPEKKEKKYYSAAEKEELANAMYRVSQVLTTEGLPAAQEAERISRDMKYPPEDHYLDSLKQRTDDIAGRLAKIEEEIWGKIFSKKAYPIYDLQHILECNHQNTHSVLKNLIVTIGRFKDGLLTIEKAEGRELKSSVAILVSHAYAEQLRTLAGLLGNWIGQCQNHIQEKQQELSG
jgi:hypothetical protein